MSSPGGNYVVTTGTRWWDAGEGGAGQWRYEVPPSIPKVIQHDRRTAVVPGGGGSGAEDAAAAHRILTELFMPTDEQPGSTGLDGEADVAYVGEEGYSTPVQPVPVELPGERYRPATADPKDLDKEDPLYNPAWDQAQDTRWRGPVEPPGDGWSPSFFPKSDPEGPPELARQLGVAPVGKWLQGLLKTAGVVWGLQQTDDVIGHVAEVVEDAGNIWSTISQLWQEDEGVTARMDPTPDGAGPVGITGGGYPYYPQSHSSGGFRA